MFYQRGRNYHMKDDMCMSVREERVRVRVNAWMDEYKN